MYHLPLRGRRGGARTELDVVSEVTLLIVPWVVWVKGLMEPVNSLINEAGNEVCDTLGSFLAKGAVEVLAAH